MPRRSLLSIAARDFASLAVVCALLGAAVAFGRSCATPAEAAPSPVGPAAPVLVANCGELVPGALFCRVVPAPGEVCYAVIGGMSGTMMKGQTPALDCRGAE